MLNKSIERVVRVLGLSLALASCAHAAEVRTYDVPRGARPHDVAPDPKAGGPVWYTAQGQGALGRLDVASGKVLGRRGEAWGAESGADRLVVVRH